jgi:hypothetical protein
MEVTGVVQVPE